jgi:hypothetical protein
MTRQSIAFAAAAVLSLGVAYFAFVLYAMNGSYSVADPARASYYVRYATLWGLAGLVALCVFLACTAFAWRKRRR